MTEDWPPYNYFLDEKIAGYSTDIVREVMDELGVEYKIHILPGARTEKYLLEKKNHVFFTFFRTPSRENLYKWVGPLATEEVYFFKKRDNPIEINTAKDIVDNNLVIVTMHEGMVLNKVREHGFKNILAKAKATRNVTSMIYRGIGDLLPITPVGAKYSLSLLGLPSDALIQTPVKLFQNDLYIAFSTMTDDAIVKKWQTALDKVKSSVRYQQIKQHYMGHNK